MDLKNPKLMYLKAALLLLGGTLAGIGILIELPTLKVLVLLVLSIWCFARAYYFAFYVIEHYIDPSYKFAGLGSFIRYARRQNRP